ncbi:thiamine phosphate synthase [Acerihabitans sp. TG2]|uniref:thiamine phosphate synthase n=1 Tax=Acerihabitans sp. TG2 TaxID=3096008 RepID=UPI002B237B84|nr:thiamine phosphate synthase [Acerihabitans sp. TG2]MEA9393346.1 thiamine phosphate synthase [Acerihabitans sp. TG2]
MIVSNTPFAPTVSKLGLYPVVDSVAWIVRLLDAGVHTLQLRIKDQPEDVVIPEIEAAILLGQRYQARVFINDYWRLAIQYGAYGVHLGQEDLDTADLAAIQRAGLRLGLSTHDDEELARALSFNPSYIALGHIFPTQTKIMPSQPQGLADLQRMVTKLTDVPTVAIGGIGIDKVDDVLATGVGSIAVVSAITKAADWRQATAILLHKIEGQEVSA